MKGFVDDIEELTESNKDFRRVLYTGKHLQLVLMSLKPGEEIGEEAVKIEGDSKPAPRRRRRETPAAEASSASAEVAPPTAAPRSPRRRDRARIRGR